MIFDQIGKIISKYYLWILKGVGYTLLVSLIGTIIGLIIGLLIGVYRTMPKPKHKFVRGLKRVGEWILNAYIEIFRGTPMIVQSVFIYYGARMLFNIHMDPLFAGFFIVSINTGAYMAETVRGGILSIDPGQVEAAKAIGMTHAQTMTSVIFPQAFRNIIPQIGNNFIINIKDTSVMFVIGFVEFFATHRNIVGVNLLYFPSAVIEMAGYLMLTLAASFLLRLLEKRLDGSDNYELVSTDSLAMSAGTYSHPSRKTPFDERSGEFDSGRPKGEY